MILFEPAHTENGMVSYCDVIPSVTKVFIFNELRGEISGI